VLPVTQKKVVLAGGIREKIPLRDGLTSILMVAPVREDGY